MASVFAYQKINTPKINRFEVIPEKPDDFDAYTREVWLGSLTDLCEIEDSYWNQPEFYGSSWKISKEHFYDNPDYSKWGVYGQGNIPKEISYTFSNLKKGDEFTLCSFFHNGFGIWTYQGFRLVPIENEYFDVELTPNELTTSPTFPIFIEGWAQKIKIKLTAKKNIPAGIYELGFDVTEPSGEYSREQVKDILKVGQYSKNQFLEECNRFLKNEEKCEYLVNQREKKYVAGGAYKSAEPLLKIIAIVK